MGTMGSGYGSECHLLRYLGRHRHQLDDAVQRATGAEAIDWLDFGFAPDVKRWPDAEWRGLDFIADNPDLQSAWARVWPQGRGIQNWDAVARIQRAGVAEWLLVEAKAHTGELRSDCGAKAKRSHDMIEAALDRTKAALGVSADRDWVKGYYQFCNRVAALHFLREHDVAARLLFIYFTGEDYKGWDCPADTEGWSPALDEMAHHVGLPEEHALSERIHKVFLPVKG